MNKRFAAIILSFSMTAASPHIAVATTAENVDIVEATEFSPISAIKTKLTFFFDKEGNLRRKNAWLTIAGTFVTTVVVGFFAITGIKAAQDVSAAKKRIAAAEKELDVTKNKLIEVEDKQKTQNAIVADKERQLAPLKEQLSAINKDLGELEKKANTPFQQYWDKHCTEACKDLNAQKKLILEKHHDTIIREYPNVDAFCLINGPKPNPEMKKLPNHLLSLSQNKTLNVDYNKYIVGNLDPKDSNLQKLLNAEQQTFKDMLDFLKRRSGAEKGTTFPVDAPYRAQTINAITAIKALKKKLDQYTKDINKLSETLTKKKAEEKLQTLPADIDNIKKQRDVLRTKIAKCQQEVEASTSALKDLDKDVAEATTKKAAVAKQRDGIQKPEFAEAFANRVLDSLGINATLRLIESLGK